MASFNGTDFRVYVTIGADDLPVGCARSESVTINNEQIDVTAKCGMPWRQHLAGGIRSMTVTVSGVATDGLAGSAHSMAALTGAYIAGSTLPLRVQSGAGDTYTGNFFCTSLERSGEHTDAEQFTATMESAGDVLYERGGPVSIPVGMGHWYDFTDPAYYTVNVSDGLTAAVDRITGVEQTITITGNLGDIANGRWELGSASLSVDTDIDVPDVDNLNPLTATYSWLSIVPLNYLTAYTLMYAPSGGPSGDAPVHKVVDASTLQLITTAGNYTRPDDQPHAWVLTVDNSSLAEDRFSLYLDGMLVATYAYAFGTIDPGQYIRLRAAINKIVPIYMLRAAAWVFSPEEIAQETNYLLAVP